MEVHVFLGKRIAYILLLIWLGALSLGALPPVADADSLQVVLETSERDIVTGNRRKITVHDKVKANVEIYQISEGKMVFVSRDVAQNGIAVFKNLVPGDYFIQVNAEGFIAKKQKVSVQGDIQIRLELRRPPDYGRSSKEDSQKPFGGFAGSSYAFGCNVVSLIFVEWQGQNTWDNTLRQNVINAATTGMNSFASQAPPEAHFTTHVENLGTYTVTDSIGDTCALSVPWVNDVLTQMGYLLGIAQIDQLAKDRAAANCGNNATCGICGLQNSGFLFFITRENSSPGNVGGWNCTGGYQVSYFSNSDGPEVYVHEIGHAFGATDEYCTNLGGNNGMYCCGWPWSILAWGCTATGGCLGGSNSNCDPLCGTDCDLGTPFLDCQDGCPAYNCTNHTPCVMDGSATLTFCDASRRQLGWVDSDCDGALDCLESSCLSDPNNISIYPDLLGCPPKYTGIFVDSSSSVELGTALFPYKTVKKAYDNAQPGSNINIKAGTYPENFTMDKRIHLYLWGCGSATVGQ